MRESILVFIVKAFGWLIRRIPEKSALAIGRLIGRIAYYSDTRHKSLAYANLKIADSETFRVGVPSASTRWVLGGLSRGISG